MSESILPYKSPIVVTRISFPESNAVTIPIRRGPEVCRHCGMGNCWTDGPPYLCGNCRAPFPDPVEPGERGEGR